MEIACVMFLTAAVLASYFVGGIVKDLKHLKEAFHRLEDFVLRVDECSCDKEDEDGPCKGKFDPSNN